MPQDFLKINEIKSTKPPLFLGEQEDGGKRRGKILLDEIIRSGHTRVTFLNPVYQFAYLQKGSEAPPASLCVRKEFESDWQFCLSLVALILSSYTKPNRDLWDGNMEAEEVQSCDLQLSFHPWHRLRQWSGLRQGLVSYCKEKASSKCSDSLALTAGLKDLTVNTSGILPSLFLINLWEDILHLWEKWPLFCSKQEKWDIRHYPIILVDWLID